MLLGDKIEQLLAAVGITEGRVEAVIGRPCGCKKRRAAINNAHLAAMRKRVSLKVWLRVKVAVVMCTPGRQQEWLASHGIVW